MAVEDHLYHKSTQLTTHSIDIIEEIDNNFNINYISKPLSPESYQSDSGYESVPSPTLSLDDQMIDSSDVCYDQTFTDLFPDLV